MKKIKKKAGELVRKNNGTFDIRVPLIPTRRIEDKRKKKPKHKADPANEETL